MSVSMDELLKEAKYLVALLEAPEYGLSTWHTAVIRRMEIISRIHAEHKLDPLREAASKALKLLQGELATVLECNCLLGENLEPIRETLDEVAEADVAELEECIGSLEAALVVNRG